MSLNLDVLGGGLSNIIMSCYGEKKILWRLCARGYVTNIKIKTVIGSQQNNITSAQPCPSCVDCVFNRIIPSTHYA